MDEFCRLIEEKKGKPWTEVRKAFAFNGKFIKPALAEALDISEEDANNWFNDKSATELSVSQLVEDINAYVSTKPANFRLLFMVDEAGQYVGTDTDMLLNLQSLVEKIGSECRGKVWVVCTGQEAIDEIIKVRADEFSRIQARFKTRLSLSSSSVDEVIQKRILKKTPEAERTLDAVYEKALQMQCRTSRASLVRHNLQRTFRSFHTSFSSCRKFLWRSANTAMQVNTSPAASVPC